MSAPTASARRIPLPTAPVLISTVYGICVIGLIAFFVGEIVFTDHDPWATDGPVDSIRNILIVGTGALVLAVLLGQRLVQTPERARVGAILFGALSVVSIVFFWSGAPGIFGACSAWLAGLTRCSRPLGGAARVVGLVGLFMAVLNVLLTVGGVLWAVAGLDS
ncbi:hypothetical protein JIG36_36230 [Actinoplanes sp. LDG1-06]|uniref:Tripartite tricarboxylate transporter TctB family protein n=1 Tax=Paractinoplanes ovalisporus TaxID=2810368 RepID=A0ABS2AM96_9ACTN|nr:hypothetical protein [Actinoplanes ovalisporus]MBM2620962.1 hypothetical protein [Actinoplanes ovalisporus]